MVECKKEKNKTTCNCSYTCDKKGMCCECLQYHKKRRELPACYFSNNAERTYDRSIEYFIEIFQKK